MVHELEDSHPHEVVVGNDDCTFNDVIEIVQPESCATFCKKLFELAKAMNVDAGEILVLERKLTMELCTQRDVLDRILTTWRSKNSSQATLLCLIKILEKHGLKMQADKLRDHFHQSNITNTLGPEAKQGCQFINKRTCGMVIILLLFGVVATVILCLTLLKNDSNPTGTEMADSFSSTTYELVTTEDFVGSEITASVTNEETTELTTEYYNTTIFPITEFETDPSTTEAPTTPCDGDNTTIFYPTLPYYIPRYLTRKVELSINQLFKIWDEDIFFVSDVKLHQLKYFAGNKRIDSSSNQLIYDTLTVPYIVLESSQHFEPLAPRTNKSVHLIQYNDATGSFIWIKTYGSILTIQKCLGTTHKATINISEEAFVNHQFRTPSKSVLLYGESGIGKTTILKNIHASAEQLPSSSNVFAVYVKLEPLLLKLNLTQSALKTVISDFCTSLKCKEALLSHPAPESFHLWLLLDGFDELLPVLHATAVSCLNELKTWPSTTMFVTTKYLILEQLENMLGVLGYQVEPFNHHNFYSFLIKFWKNKYHTIREETIGPFTLSLVNIYLPDRSVTERKRFGENPLYCQFIAEIYFSEALAWNNENSRPDLAKMDSNKKIITTIDELYTEKISLAINSSHENSHIQRLLSNHAIWQMFSWYSEHNNSYPALLPEELNAVIETGIVVEEANLTSFVHPSLYEYFLALHTYTNKILPLLDSSNITKDQCNALEFIFSESALYYFKDLIYNVTFESRNSVITKPQLFSSTWSSNFFYFDYFIYFLNQKSDGQRIETLGWGNCFENSQSAKHSSIVAALAFQDHYNLFVLQQSLFLKKSTTEIMALYFFSMVDVGSFGLSCYEYWRQNFAFLSSSRIMQHIAEVAGSSGNFQLLFGIRLTSLIDISCPPFLNLISNLSLFDSNRRESQVNILHTLLQNRTSILEKSCPTQNNDIDVKPILYYKRDVSSILELISFGANITSITHRNQNLLHVFANPTSGMTGNDLQLVVGKIIETSPTTFDILINSLDISRNTPVQIYLKRFKPLAATLQIFSDHGGNFTNVNIYGTPLFLTSIDAMVPLDTIKILVGFRANNSKAFSPVVVGGQCIQRHEANFCLPCDPCSNKVYPENQFCPVVCNSSDATCIFCEERCFSIQKSCEFCSTSTNSAINTPGLSYMNALHVAAGRGDPDIVKYLLSIGYYVNTRCLPYGATPLDVALINDDSNSHAAVFKLLLDEGALVTAGIYPSYYHKWRLIRESPKIYDILMQRNETLLC